LQGIENAAFIEDVLIYLQDSPVDMAHFYRADAAWMGLFDLQGQYFKPAYAFLAAGKMLSTPQRLELSGSDTIGFAALAGRSSDGKTVQILISNYEIPANHHPRDMQPPEGALPKHMPEFPQMKSLPARTNIHYKDNSGFHLTINALPWGKRPFTVQRYRLTDREPFVMVQESTGNGGKFDVSDALLPPAIELIILKQH